MKWQEAVLGAALVWLFCEILAASRARPAGQPACDDTRARGALLCLAGRHSEAIPLLSLAISSSPRDAQALYFRGRAHAGLGMYREALTDMVTAARLDPSLRSILPPIARFALILGRLAGLRALALAWRVLEWLQAACRRCARG